MTSTSDNIQLTEELKDKIRYALKQVVSQVHPEPSKKLLKDMHGRITCACPYCGDSHKDLPQNVVIYFGIHYNITVTTVVIILTYIRF